MFLPTIYIFETKSFFFIIFLFHNFIGYIEEITKSKKELESERKQSVEECEIALQQKEGLLKYTEDLKIKILNLEEEFQTLQGLLGLIGRRGVLGGQNRLLAVVVFSSPTSSSSNLPSIFHSHLAIESPWKHRKG